MSDSRSPAQPAAPPSKPQSTPGPKPADSGYAKLEVSLREQLRQSPDLHLTRLMLLELYFKTGHRAAYLAEARKLHRRVGDPETSLEWQRCAAMGRGLDPEEQLYRQGSNELLYAAEAATVAASKPRSRRIGESKEYKEAFEKLAEAYARVVGKPAFLASLDRELVQIAGRPSSLLHLRNLSQHAGGAQIYLKREDMSPRDTHLTIMVTGQALLARELGCDTLVTSTTNGHRGLMVAAAAARYNLGCTIYMDSRDRQVYLPRVFRMSLMGAEVRTVPQGKVDLREVALNHWANDRHRSIMVTGLDAVPEPFPAMHRDFIAAIGRECKLQVRAAARRMPRIMVARGERLPDALGLFPAFVGDEDTRLVCIEPQASPAPEADDDADLATLEFSPEAGHPSLDAREGLSYPSVTREHQWLRSIGNVEYIPVGDDKIVDAATDLARYEGLTPSRETARALAWLLDEASKLDPSDAVVLMFADEGGDPIVDIGEEFATSLEKATAFDRKRPG